MVKGISAVIASVLVGLACCVTLVAQQVDEYGVKRAFVYNFLQFVEWPQEKLDTTRGSPPALSGPLAVCILGESPIAERLSSLTGRLAKGHSIRVRTITDPPDASSCHVLYIPTASAGRLTEFAARTRSKGVLIIGEDSPMGSSGAVITLVLTANRITFDVDLKEAAAQELIVSSKLLRLARRVSGAPENTSELLNRARGN